MRACKINGLQAFNLQVKYQLVKMVSVKMTSIKCNEGLNNGKNAFHINLAYWNIDDLSW